MRRWGLRVCVCVCVCVCLSQFACRGNPNNPNKEMRYCPPVEISESNEQWRTDTSETHQPTNPTTQWTNTIDPTTNSFRMIKPKPIPNESQTQKPLTGAAAAVWPLMRNHNNVNIRTRPRTLFVSKKQTTAGNATARYILGVGLLLVR